MMVSRTGTWGISLTLLLCLGLPDMTRAAQDADAHRFGVFWKQFSQAVVEDKRATVADLTKLPLTESSMTVRPSYASIRRCLRLRCAAVLSRSSPFMISTGIPSSAASRSEQIFVFGLVNGLYLFTEIGVNDSCHLSRRTYFVY